MKRQEHTDTANEFAAEAYKLFSQRDGQDTADCAAAVAAAIKTASAGRDEPEIPRPGSSRRDCPTPAAGRRLAARPLAPRSPVTRWPGLRTSAPWPVQKASERGITPVPDI